MHIYARAVPRSQSLSKMFHSHEVFPAHLCIVERLPLRRQVEIWGPTVKQAASGMFSIMHTVITAFLVGLVCFGEANAGVKVFPPGTGMIDVTDEEYGANPNDDLDDTAAIQLAISEGVLIKPEAKVARIVYLPPGIYLVCDTLSWKKNVDDWGAYVTLQGAGDGHTIIKLQDNCPGFGSTEEPKPVIATGSLEKNYPTRSDTKDSGFRNNIRDLTIEIGAGNSGAVGIDFLGNNQASIENVTVRSDDPQHRGHTGIAFTRAFSGPLLLKNVTVDGFDCGIHAKWQKAGITAENIVLRNQLVYGIRNAGNVVSIRGLRSMNNVTAVYNESGRGLLTLIDAHLAGGSTNRDAILDDASGPSSGSTGGGGLYLRSVSSNGYQATLRVIKPDNTVHVDTAPRIAEFSSNPVSSLTETESRSLHLPIKETPDFHEEDVNRWERVSPCGQSNSYCDITSQLQDAIDSAAGSGKTTVYIPPGVYTVRETIMVHGPIRRLLAFNTTLIPASTSAVWENPVVPQPFFHVVNDAGGGEYADMPLLIEGFQVHRGGASDDSVDGMIVVGHESVRPLVLKHNLLGDGAILHSYSSLGSMAGDVFIEDTVGSAWRFNGPQKVWAHQLNLEGDGGSGDDADVRVLNNGADLWVMGVKTETRVEPQPLGMFKTISGGKTEVLGALFSGRIDIPSTAPMLESSRAGHSFVYATITDDSGDNHYWYDLHIKETTDDGASYELRRGDTPARSAVGSSMVPLYASYVSDPSSSNSLVNETFDHANHEGNVVTAGSANVTLWPQGYPSDSYSLMFIDADDTMYSVRPHVRWDFPTQVGNILDIAFDIRKGSAGENGFVAEITDGVTVRAIAKRTGSSVLMTHKVNGVYTSTVVASGLQEENWYRVRLRMPTTAGVSGFYASVTDLSDANGVCGGANPCEQFSVPFNNGLSGPISRIHFKDDGNSHSIVYVDNVKVDIVANGGGQ